MISNSNEEVLTHETRQAQTRRALEAGASSVRSTVGKCHKGEIHGHTSNFSKENHIRSQASHGTQF